MANKRNKKKLDSEQAIRIRTSWLISTVYFICVLVIGLILKPDQAVNYWLTFGITGTLVIFSVSYFMIFNDSVIELEDEMKIITAQHLSYTDFKQVYFLVADDRSYIINMMNKILQKEECKFYAKLTENNNIYLIVKDKHDEEVFSEVIDYVYFNYNFKFKEESHNDIEKMEVLILKNLHLFNKVIKHIAHKFIS